MSKHTPGPWAIFGCDDDLEIIPAMRPGTIAAIKSGDARRDADADLIAAAPDLLAFAQYVEEMDPGNPAPLFVRARAAIAKAEGRS